MTGSGAVFSVGNAEIDHVGARSCIAARGNLAGFRPREEQSDLFLRLTDQLAYVESVFANATAGSPAQFRAREEADSLREQLCSIGGG